MRRLLVTGFCAIYLGLVALTSSAFATPYGSQSYGACQYQTGCPAPPTPTPSTPTPTPPVPATPEPAPNPPQVTVTTPNLSDNQVITKSPFTIVVEVNNNSTDVTAPPQTGWVSFYIDDTLLGTTYNPNSDGTYQYRWDVRKYPGKILAISVYDKNGSIIGRRDIPVTIALAPLPPSPGSTEQPAASEGTGVGAIGRLIHQTPPFVAKSFPYWIFVILLVLAIRLIWQAIRETIGNSTMQALLAKQRLIADEKDNFIALSSHYLHTPLTVIRNGADTMLATGEASPDMLAPLRSAIDKLKQQIDDILGQVESNGILGSIKAPSQPIYTTSTFGSPFFWIPVAAVGAICIFANILFGLVGQIDLGINNLFVQIILFVVAALFFFFSFRTHQIRTREHDKSKQLVDYQNAVDVARNTFIKRSTDTLGQTVAEINAAKTSLPDTTTKGYVEEGSARFNDLLAKFSLLAQLQTGAKATGISTFPLKDALETALVPFAEQIASKKLAVHINTHNINVTQNPQLFGYVLQTVIDNAVKFSSDGGDISIAASKASGRLQVTISDGGIGIAAEKLPSLFQPFSRATSVMQFDYEGLGFSLFLDKIIMDYLEGDIIASSTAGQGTIVTVTA